MVIETVAHHLGIGIPRFIDQVIYRICCRRCISFSSLWKESIDSSQINRRWGGGTST
jgi:hypothetical protein